ncbi:hypothetical protein HanRHA438_Chr13g0599751 [Helianthus annuus]|nr:hypothetical protein HanRHA438_Chr13g0599751 [Helianthus annuus]
MPCYDVHYAMVGCIFVVYVLMWVFYNILSIGVFKPHHCSMYALCGFSSFPAISLLMLEVFNMSMKMRKLSYEMLVLGNLNMWTMMMIHSWRGSFKLHP